jgi:hypothetical protein
VEGIRVNGDPKDVTRPAIVPGFFVGGYSRLQAVTPGYGWLPAATLSKKNPGIRSNELASVCEVAYSTYIKGRKRETKMTEAILFIVGLIFRGWNRNNETTTRNADE